MHFRQIVLVSLIEGGFYSYNMEAKRLVRRQLEKSRQEMASYFTILGHCQPNTNQGCVTAGENFKGKKERDGRN